MVVAGQLAGMAERKLGALPIGIRAWDGSVAGPAGRHGARDPVTRRSAPAHVEPERARSRTRVRERGLDIEGDLAIGLSQSWGLVRRGDLGWRRS